MKSKLFILVIIITILLPFLWNGSGLVAQNIAITDDDTYNADSSAMLDVKSLSKGMLVPRLTTVQRNAVLNPATGLLVFDTDDGSFYFFNGTSWTNLSSGNANGIIGYTSPDKVYLNDITDKFGIGTVSPSGKLDIKSDVSIGLEKPIFNVVNSTGDTVFAVYEQGVRINVYDDPAAKATGSKGGFAVGGFSPAKGTTTNEFLRITPDSVRIYVEDIPAVKATSSKGGFAVGGFSPAKAGLTNSYFRVTSDSTRIYTSDTVSGFGVESLGSGTSTSYMRLTPSNYFIGHQAGESITTGLYNSFFGYQSGISNDIGNYNVFTGYKSGFSNLGGSYNTFLGYKSGLTNSGSDNTFIGFEAGSLHQSQGGNVFIGSKAGQNDLYGTQNVCIGESAGANNNSGYANVFLGYQCGYTNSFGNANVFIGQNTGYSNTNGIQNIFVGPYSGYSNTDGEQNIFLGTSSGWYNTTGNYNIFIGAGSGTRNTTANNNLFIGGFSGNTNTTGSSNVFIGKYAGYFNETGASNVFLGVESGMNNIDGLSNTFTGVNSGEKNTSGSANNFYGLFSGKNTTTGSENSCFGASSGFNNNIGSMNVMLGNQSGFNNLSNNNTMIGYSAGFSNANGTRNVFIGSEAGWSETGSYKLYIEPTTASVPLIWGDFQTDQIGINRVATANTFEVGGEASKLTAGAWLANSDKRIKTDITDINDSYKLVLALHPVKFKYTDEWLKRNPSIKKQYYYNFIAQEYQNVFPESVKGSGEYLDGDSKEILQIDTYNAQIVTIKAVQDLIKENNNLKFELEKLSSINNEKSNEIKEIKAQLEKINTTLYSTTKK